jgi:hypothetical protein
MFLVSISVNPQTMMNYNSSLLHNKALFNLLIAGEQNDCAKSAILIRIKAAATHDRRHSHNHQLKVSF